MSVTKIYTPDDYRKYRLFSSIRDLINVFSAYRGLIIRLIKVNLTQQYKRSFLGTAWIFFSPFFSVLLWVLLNGTGLLNPGNTGIPYMAYVFISTSIWILFISFYKSISETYTGRGAEMLHNNFPHVVVVIEKSAVCIINFLIPLSLSIAVLLIFRVDLSWTLLLFPIALLPLMLLGIGLGLVFSVLKIVALDFTTAFDNSLELLKYISPVVFATTVNNHFLRTVLRYNPLTYLIDFPRRLLLNEDLIHINAYLLCSAGAVIFLLFAYRFFSVSNPVVFEKITV